MNTDVVFCVDVTASMDLLIDDIKRRILDFAQGYLRYLTKDEAHNVRIRLVAFRAYGEDEAPMTETPFYDVSSEWDGLQSAVASLRCDGGVSETSGLEAFALAMQSPFVCIGERRTAIVLFTDAESYPVRKGSDAFGYPEGMPGELAEFATWWEGGAKRPERIGFTPEYARLVLFSPDCYPWSSLEALKRCKHVLMTSESGVPDFEEVYAFIAA